MEIAAGPYLKILFEHLLVNPLPGLGIVGQLRPSDHTLGHFLALSLRDRHRTHGGEGVAELLPQRGHALERLGKLESSYSRVSVRGQQLCHRLGKNDAIGAHPPHEPDIKADGAAGVVAVGDPHEWGEHFTCPVPGAGEVDRAGTVEKVHRHPATAFGSMGVPVNPLRRFGVRECLKAESHAKVDCFLVGEKFIVVAHDADHLARVAGNEGAPPVGGHILGAAFAGD